MCIDNRSWTWRGNFNFQPPFEYHRLIIFYVPEVLNVHMNEIYKKLTTIKSNKFKTEKYFKKSHFLSQKLIFSCLKKKKSF